MAACWTGTGPYGILGNVLFDANVVRDAAKRDGHVLRHAAYGHGHVLGKRHGHVFGNAAQRHAA